MNFQNNYIPKNFGQITDHIYRSSLPNGKQIKYLSHQIELNCIIDLSDRKREVVEHTSVSLNMYYCKFPMIDTVIDEKQIKRVLELINDLSSNRKILIHCFHGRHRTGLIASMIMGQRGFTTNEILKHLFNFQFGDPQKHSVYFDYILNNIC